MRSIDQKTAAKPPSAACALPKATPRDWRQFRDDEEPEAPACVVVRSLVGVLASAPAGDGPAYTLSPEPMTEEPTTDAQGRPRSVWSALLCLDAEAYAELVAVVQPECSKQDAALVLADAMLWEATQTRRFEPGPDGGWRVWIDAAGRARVSVWP